jgi:integrase
MTHYAKGKRHERLTRETDSLVGRISPANRSAVEKAVLRMRNKTLKEGSVRAFANALFKADHALGGRPFEALRDKPDDLADMMARLHRENGERYVASMSVHIRKHWARMYGIRSPKDLPLDVYDALYVREPRAKLHGYVIPDSDFEAMLKCAADQDGEISTLQRGFMLVVLLWVLRDCGWRISEALSLNMGDIILDEQGARFVLREDAPDLKTGARPIYAARCVPALRAWMAMHPQSGNPQAPLFLGLRDKTGLERLSYQTADRKIRAIGIASGASARVPTGKAITAHDFRHTRATEWAKNREGSEEEMRKYFGWAPGSKMPSLYIHFTLGDMKDSVLRAAAVSPLGTRLPTVEAGVSKEDLQLLKKLRSLLA